MVADQNANARAHALSRRRTFALVSEDPPTVRYEGELWLICPVDGFWCAHTRSSTGWAQDVMDIHVQIKHRSFT